MSQPPRPFPAPYLAFLERYQRGEYWESHEVLEDAWREGRSDFYHGLILLASAFVHAQRGNARGVRAQLRKAEPYLRPFRPAYLGLDVDELLGRISRLRAAAEITPDPRGMQAPPLLPHPDRLRGDEPELRAPDAT